DDAGPQGCGDLWRRRRRRPREGARVFLAGRTKEKLDRVAVEVRAQGGMAETLPEDFDGREAIITSIEEATLLKRAATLAEVGNVAAFVASDLARTITATEINISAGAMME
ncbi:MAG: SDR family oxidoreductase, partial [Chloroflexi bacterium]|nr:SDR family oxidoreductase [Chloroflexota bacterium]